MDSASETEFRVICPVCQQPNPVGTRFCKLCWGAIIHSDSLVLSLQEAERRLSRMKSRKMIKAMAISLASLVILASVMYPALYYGTDIVTLMRTPVPEFYLRDTIWRESEVKFGEMLAIIGEGNKEKYPWVFSKQIAGFSPNYGFVVQEGGKCTTNP